MNYHRNWSDTALTTWGQASDNDSNSLINGNTTTTPSAKPYSNSNSLYDPTRPVTCHAYGPPQSYSHAASAHNLGSSTHCMLMQPGSGGSGHALYHPQTGSYPLPQYPNSLAQHQFAPRSSFTPQSQAPPSLSHTQQSPVSQPTCQPSSRLGQPSVSSRGPIPLFSSASGVTPDNNLAGAQNNASGGSGVVAPYFNTPLSSQTFYPSHLGHSYQTQPQYYLYPSNPLSVTGSAQQSTLYSSYIPTSPPSAASATCGAPMLRIPYTQGGPNATPSHIQGAGVGLGATAALNLLNSVLSTRYASQRGQSKQQQYTASKGPSSTAQTSILSRPQTTLSSSRNGAAMPLMSNSLLRQMENVSLDDRNIAGTSSRCNVDETEGGTSALELSSSRPELLTIHSDASASNMAAYDPTTGVMSNTDEQNVEEGCMDAPLSTTSNIAVNPFPNQGIRILARPKRQRSPKRASEGQGGTNYGSDSGSKEESGSVKPPMMTLQEREANYAAARLRILGSAYPEETSDTDDAKEEVKVATEEPTTDSSHLSITNE